jgi:hypothetical protein
LRSTAALEAAGVPYAVIGAKAVAYWVETLDDGASRNTPNVDHLLRRNDLPAATSALAGAEFVQVEGTGGPTIFLDGPGGRPQQAVRVWCSGRRPVRVRNPCRTYPIRWRVRRLRW